MGTILVLALLLLASQAQAHGDKDKDRADGDGSHHRHHAKATLHPSAHAAAMAGAPGDGGLTAVATSLPGRLQFSLVASAIGGALQSAHLEATLPEVGGAWSLAGPGAPDCTLSGRQVSCDLPAMAAGDAELVQASAPVAVPPQWEPAVAAHLMAAGDFVAANDAASASVGILLA